MSCCENSAAGLATRASGSFAWHVTHELTGVVGSCAAARSARSRASEANAAIEYSAARIGMLLGVITNDREHHQVREPGPREDGKNRTRLAAACAAIEKRNQHQHERQQAEADHAQPLALEAKHVAGQKLQHVKHREKVPLGTD